MVTDGSYLPAELTNTQNMEKDVISRSILITDKSLSKTDGKESVSLLNYYADHLPEPVKILESGACGCVSPAGLYVIQMTTKGNLQTTAKDDLEPIVQKFFQISDNVESIDPGDGDDRPRVLWSLFFNYTSVSVSAQLASNVVVTPPLDGNLTYADLVPRLKEDFIRLWPDTEFLPAPPNPEESSDGLDAVPNDPGINGYTPDP